MDGLAADLAANSLAAEPVEVDDALAGSMEDFVLPPSAMPLDEFVAAGFCANDKPAADAVGVGIFDTLERSGAFLN